MKTSLGDAIFDARTRAGMSQQKLADLIGVSRVAIGQWEKGHNFPATERLIKLIETLDIAWKEVEGFGDEPIAPSRPAQVDAVADPNDVPLFHTAYSLDETYFLGSNHVAGSVRTPAGIAVANRRSLYAIYVTTTDLAPRFKPGEILFASSARPAAPGDFVIIKMKSTDKEGNEHWLLRRLIGRVSREIEVESPNTGKREVLAISDIWMIHRAYDWPELI